MNVCTRSERSTDKYEIYEMEWSITILAVVRFYTEVIKKLPQNSKFNFGKVENEQNSYIKKADLKFHKMSLPILLYSDTPSQIC